MSVFRYFVLLVDWQEGAGHSTCRK